LSESSKKLNKNLTLEEAYRKLSRREGEVLEKLKQGKTNKQIASELYVTKNTIEKHVTNIGEILNLKGKGKIRNWINTINKPKNK